MPNVTHDTTDELTTPAEKRGHILVVDDDRDIGELLAAGLSLRGHQTVTAEDGEQAMSRLGGESFDLVLVDLLMPIVGGLRLISWLRTEQKSSIPIVVFTGHDDSETLASAREAGADEVLVKPFDLDKLCKIVARLIAAR